MTIPRHGGFCTKNPGDNQVFASLIPDLVKQCGLNAKLEEVLITLASRGQRVCFEN